MSPKSDFFTPKSDFLTPWSEKCHSGPFRSQKRGSKSHFWGGYKKLKKSHSPRFHWAANFFGGPEGGSLPYEGLGGPKSVIFSLFLSKIDIFL